MDYERLNFQDYFTICSENWNDLPTNLEMPKYREIKFKHGRHEHRVNYQVRYDRNRNCIQCIFQQTADKSDWKSNFNFPYKIYDKFTYNNQLIQLKCHRGWGSQWMACQNSFRTDFSALIATYPDAFVEVIGWSLGSGMAQLAAEDIYFKFGIKSYLYTFGSVKPFFGHKTINFVRKCCVKAYNFYDHNDIVGYMVPLPGWRAINHIKIKFNRFSILRLFNPQKYHTKYDTLEFYLSTY